MVKRKEILDYASPAPAPAQRARLPNPGLVSLVLCGLEVPWRFGMRLLYLVLWRRGWFRGPNTPSSSAVAAFSLIVILPAIAAVLVGRHALVRRRSKRDSVLGLLGAFGGLCLWVLFWIKL